MRRFFSLSTFSSANHAVSISYDPNVWQIVDVPGVGKGIGIKSKDSDALSCFIVRREYSEALSEKTYMDKLVERNKKYERKGSTSVSKLKIDDRDFPIMHTEIPNDKQIGFIDNLFYDIFLQNF